MELTQDFFRTLLDEASQSPRLRQSFDMRTSASDQSQRMLNAIEPGTIMPIHRHRNTSATMVMVRGKLIERFYDDNGNITDEFVMSPLGSVAEPVEVPMVQIDKGQWHSLEVIEEGTVIFEAKDGKYEPAKPEDIIQ